MDQAPEWFTNIFLDFIGYLSKRDNKARFLKHGSAIIKDVDRGNKLRGYAITSKDPGAFFFVGKKSIIDKDTGKILNVEYQKMSATC